MLSIQEHISPFRLADRLAFHILWLYCLLWPVWAASEAHDSIRFYGFRLAHLVLAGIFFLAFVSVPIKKSMILSLRPLYLLIFYAVLTLIWTSNLRYGTWIIINLFSVIVFAQILSEEPKRQRRVQLAFLVGVTILVVLALLSSGFNIFGQFRFYMNRIQFAIICAIALVFVTARFFHKWQTREVLSAGVTINAILMLLFGAVLFLSGSRTALVAGLFGIAAVALFQISSMGKLKVLPLRFFLVGATVSIALVFMQSFVDRRDYILIDRYARPILERDFSARNLLVIASARYIVSSPQIALIGGGSGSFDQGIVEYLDRPLFLHAIEQGRRNRRRPYPHFAAHNDFLRVFCEEGLIGLLLFTIFYLRIWKSCLANDLHSRIPVRLGIFVALFVSSLGIDVLNFELYPIVMAMVIAPLCLTAHPTRAGEGVPQRSACPASPRKYNNNKR